MNMNLLKRANRWRKALMKKLTREMRLTNLAGTVGGGKAGITKVLICRPNHRLGNLLLISPLIQEVAETLPQAQIDLFVKGNVAPLLFRHYRQIGNIIQLPKKPAKHIFQYLRGWYSLRKNNYDLVINAVNHSSSGRIAAHVANARYRFLGDIDRDIERQFADHEHMAKYPVYSFRKFIEVLGHRRNEHRVPGLDLKLTPGEKAEGKKLLLDIVKNEKKTICLYTYATGIKCYSTEWWKDLYEKLLARYPQYNIIEVLPVENVSQIGFRAPSFYSRDLRAIGALVASTEVFISADSGMMHLASAAKVPTIGLFKAKNLNTYAPYNEKSIALNITGNDTAECVRAVDRILPTTPP